MQRYSQGHKINELSSILVYKEGDSVFRHISDKLLKVS